MVFIRPAAGEPLGVDRFLRGSSAAGAGTAANAAACRLVHPTRPIRPAAGADGPAAGGPATQKGGWRISFTPRPAPLPFRSGAMTPFPGRAGAAAHPKVKRRPPFSVPAAVPDHDYGAVGREITPARPRRWLRGSATSPVPGHRDAAPLPAAAPPLSAGPNTSVVCATYNLQPTSALWAALVDLRQRRPGVAVRLYVDAQAADGPFKGRGGASRVGGVGGRGGTGVRRPTATSRRAPGLSTGEMARRLRGAVVMRTRAPEDRMRAVTSHAKLLSIDHRFLLVGSANLSYSAEERNVELGLRLDDPALAHGVEKQLRDLEEVVYEQVHG